MRRQSGNRPAHTCDPPYRLHRGAALHRSPRGTGEMAWHAGIEECSVNRRAGVGITGYVRQGGGRPINSLVPGDGQTIAR